MAWDWSFKTHARVRDADSGCSKWGAAHQDLYTKLGCTKGSPLKKIK